MNSEKIGIMNKKQKILHTVAIVLLCAIGAVPWAIMHPHLQEDHFTESEHHPLDVEMQIIWEQPEVIYLEPMVITVTRKPARVAQNVKVVCRWHGHDESTGIRVCEYGNEIHYPTVQ